ncbi:MAG: hypothetical protein E7040_06205 [Lentisphaerae bacterium]|nr:hypothetical protein [Lentisphaerota bacterium]
MALTKSEKILEEIYSELQAGAFGQPDDRFLTTRELVVRKNISLKTAFRIIEKLRESGVIRKVGRDYRIARTKPIQKQDGKMLQVFLLSGQTSNITNLVAMTRLWWFLMVLNPQQT